MQLFSFRPKDEVVRFKEFMLRIVNETKDDDVVPMCAAYVAEMTPFLNVLDSHRVLQSAARGDEVRKFGDRPSSRMLVFAICSTFRNVITMKKELAAKWTGLLTVFKRAMNVNEVNDADIDGLGKLFTVLLDRAAPADLNPFQWQQTAASTELMRCVIKATKEPPAAGNFRSLLTSNPKDGLDRVYLDAARREEEVNAAVTVDEAELKRALVRCSVFPEIQSEADADDALRTVRLERQNGRLGITVGDASSPTDPVPILGVTEGTPAAEQLQVGDQIVAVDGQSCRGMTAEDCEKLVGSKQTVDLSLAVPQVEKVLDNPFDYESVAALITMLGGPKMFPKCPRVPIFPKETEFWCTKNDLQPGRAELEMLLVDAFAKHMLPKASPTADELTGTYIDMLKMPFDSALEYWKGLAPHEKLSEPCLTTLALRGAQTQQTRTSVEAMIRPYVGTFDFTKQLSVTETPELKAWAGCWLSVHNLMGPVRTRNTEDDAPAYLGVDAADVEECLYDMFFPRQFYGISPFLQEQLTIDAGVHEKWLKRQPLTVRRIYQKLIKWKGSSLCIRRINCNTD